MLMQTILFRCKYLFFKRTMCRNFSHLAVKMYFAFKQSVLSSASLFQMCVAFTVAIMYQKTMTGCLLISLLCL